MFKDFNQLGVIGFDPCSLEICACGPSEIQVIGYQGLGSRTSGIPIYRAFHYCQTDTNSKLNRSPIAWGSRQGYVSWVCDACSDPFSQSYCPKSLQGFVTVSRNIS